MAERYAVVLDSGPLGMLLRGRDPRHQTSHVWFDGLLSNGHRVYVPQIVDYEIRRELIRINSQKSLRILDHLARHSTNVFLAPVSTAVFDEAASLWALARRMGQPTAHEHALDIDVILAATARLLRPEGFTTIVATTNVKHLSRFTLAAQWDTIT